MPVFDTFKNSSYIEIDYSEAGFTEIEADKRLFTIDYCIPYQ